MATLLEYDLKRVPVGVVPPAPTGALLPTVLVAIVGPRPMSYGTEGRTTLDDTLAMCAAYGPSAVPVFIPGFITEEEAASTVPRSRLRGHTQMRNWGVQAAIDGGYDYLFLIENDACFTPNTLERLLRHGQDIILPRLTFPDFPPVEDMNYGPHDRPTREGLLRLTWAAHCCILFKVEALKRIAPPVWRGFGTEGEDHYFWQQQGCYPHMDVDTPVKILELARGFKDFYQIPFRAHNDNGTFCIGPVYLSHQSRDMGLYLCKAEGCKYEMITMKPQTIRPDEMNNPSLMVEMATLREHWEGRAMSYPRLQWPQDKGYLAALMDAAVVVSDDYVLDAGTGPGYIAHEVAPVVHQVVGLDVSPTMLARVNGRTAVNTEFVEGDIRAIPYPRGRFDKVFARMVVHGLTGQGDADKAMRECLRVLVPGGKFIFSEGVPISRMAQQWYTEMFKLKEDRMTMTVPFMNSLMVRAGFKYIKAAEYIMEGFSIRNWLDNSGLPKESTDRIMEIHRTMPDAVRKAYKATITQDDVVIQSKFAILTGTK